MADLKPLTTPNLDTRGIEEKALSTIFNDVKNIKNKSFNLSASQDTTATKVMGALEGFDYGLSNILWGGEPSPNNFYITVKGKTAGKLEIIQEINLNLSFKIIPLGSSTTAGGNYTTDLYFNLYQIASKGDTYSYNLWLCYPLGELTWNETATIYTMTDPTRSFRLSDYIEEREFNYSFMQADFSNTNNVNANDKITKQQYETLQNETTSFLAQIVYNPDTLTAGQITHMNSMFNPDPTSGSFGIVLGLTFTTFGVLANYEPSNLT